MEMCFWLSLLLTAGLSVRRLFSREARARFLVEDYYAQQRRSEGASLCSRRQWSNKREARRCWRKLSWWRKRRSGGGADEHWAAASLAAS